VDYSGGSCGAGRLIPLRSAVFLLLLLAWAVPARAQSFETIGVRAQGMGGAFVGLADDATAVWWNPAGLAGGALFNAILERDTLARPSNVDAAAADGRPAQEGTLGGFTAAYPALGLSYYHVRIRQETPLSATDTAGSDRQIQGAVGVSLDALSLSQFGATVGQSLGQHLVISTTLKLLRGHAAAAEAPAGPGVFDQARQLEGPGKTRGDLDVGAMARVGDLRIGVAMRNATSPSFGEGAGRIELRRRVRAGVSVTGHPWGGADTLTVAADADLRKNPTPFGLQRRAALGAEAWLFQRRLGLRGGVSDAFTGDAPRAVSAGLSVAVRPGAYVEGFITGGDAQGRHAWGTDLRLTY
jgi:hypothetical protein